MTNKNPVLSHVFQEFFTVEYAKTAEQRSQAYALRYRVYCDEFSSIAADKFPDQEEKDEYDEFSLHCLIRHNKTGLAAACVRLVPALDDKNNSLQLPLEVHGKDNLDHDYIDSLNLDRAMVCEISRLVVDKPFRQRSGEALTRFGEIQAFDCTQPAQRPFSIIAIAAFLAATALTDIHGKTNVFVMLEPFLPAIMERSGIVFNKAGFDMNYRGIRAPYFIQTQSVLENMHDNLKELYDLIYKQLK